jgi:MFS family permease
VLTITPVAIVFFAPLAGVIADHLGRKKLLVLAVFCVALTGVSGLFLGSLIGILVGRVLLGTSVAAVMTVTTTLVGDYFTGAERERFMGWKSAAIGFGGVVFLIIAGFLADLHWRAPFLVYLLALGILPFVVVNLFEPERVPAGPRAKAAPLDLPFQLIAAIYGVGMLLMIAYYVIPVQLPFRLRELGITDPSSAGLAIAGSMLSSALTSLFYGRLKGRLAFDWIFVLAFSFLGLGFVLVAMADDYVLILLATAVSGIGIGAAMPNAMTWLMTVTRPEIRGRLVGGFTTFVFLGQFLSPLLMQPVTGHYGLAAAFGVAALLVVVMALLFAAAATRRSLRGAPV